MKKLFVVLFVGVFIAAVAGFALAGGGSAYDKFEASAGNSYIDSKTYGNEEAYSSVNGGSYAKNEGQIDWNGWLAGGLVTGEADAVSDTDTKTCIHDFGLTSKAGAFASNEGSASGEGLSAGAGFACFDSWNQTYVEVWGSSYQYNQAGETGYGSGTGGSGWNESEAVFNGSAYDYSSCSSPLINLSFSEEDIHGSAQTGGFTSITVDPYGAFQSADGSTGNFAGVQLCGEDQGWTSVQGQGALGVGAFSNNCGSSAGALANGSFGYTGSDFGAGYVNNHTDAFTGNGVSSSHASGSAGAFSH